MSSPPFRATGALEIPDEHTCDVAERLARTIEQLEAFRIIATTVGSDADIESVLQLISDKTTQLMRAERTTLYLIETDRSGSPCLNSIISEGTGPIRLAIGQGIAGTVAQRRERLNIKDVYKSPLFDRTVDQRTGFVTRSCLCAPIFNIQRELIAVVQVINKTHGHFTPDDEELLTSIGAQIGVSLTQHRFTMSLLHKNVELTEAQEKLRRRNDELDMLYSLEREVAAAPDLPSLMTQALTRCVRAFQISLAAAVVIDGAQNRLFVSKKSSDSDEICTEDKLMVRRPNFLSAVIRQGDCLKLTTREIETLPEQTARGFGTALRALLIAPFVHENTSFGALIFGSTSPNPDIFSPSDAKYAALFASHIAPLVATHIDREAQEKLRRLTAIGQMMSSLLHDMKTPLANISGYVELLVTQQDPERRAQFAQIIDRQVDTLRNMSAEILQFASGQSAILQRPTSLHDILAEACALLHAEAERRHIELSCDERFRGTLICDADKIQRVLVNLVKNALEAIDQHGHVLISTYADDAHVYIAVQDDGPGIPPAIARTLFDAFVTSGKRGGTGLGLSIVRKIVEEHGAEITWHPVEPHGTAFVIAFPVQS